MWPVLSLGARLQPGPLGEGREGRGGEGRGEGVEGGNPTNDFLLVCAQRPEETEEEATQ